MSARADIPHDQGFVEVADRCWVARHEFLDVNVGVVAGERGLLVVDTHASEAAARRVVDDVRRLARGDVVAVVNTHEHFDHTFGNIVFSEEYDGLELFAHEAAAQALRRHRETAETRVLVPDNTFSSARAVDLGDRLVELVHPGRGHTAGDTVILVPDADVMFAGDLVEESALRCPEWGSGVPGFGDDCFPLEWPHTMDLVVGLLSGETVVVPGHGSPVDLDFVSEQRGSIGIVAQTIVDLAGKGVPVEEALTAAEWPYPTAHLADAVRRGYQHLPRSARSLPLL